MATDWNALSDEAFRAAFADLVARRLPNELRFMRKQRPLFDEVAVWYHALAEEGWLAPVWPVEHGGMGLSPAKHMIYVEEWRGSMPAHSRPWDWPHRPAADRARDGGAESPFPAEDPDRRACLVPGIFGAEFRVGSREPAHGRRARGRPFHRQRPEDLDHARLLRELDLRARAHQPRREGPQKGITVLLIDLRSPGVRCGPSPISGARRTSAKSSSTMSACPSPTWSARSTRAGTSPSRCWATSASSWGADAA